MARLQNEVGTKDFFRGTKFLTKNAPKLSPKLLSLYFVGQTKSRKIPAKLPAKFPSQKSKENSPTSLCRSAGRRKFRSVPEGGADSPAAIFLAGRCPNLGMDSLSCCWKIRKSFSAASKFAGKPFQRGISDSHSLRGK